MKKNIFKHSALSFVLPKIEPIKNIIPDFYKNSEPIPNYKKIKELPLRPNFKYCNTFLDSFTTGYYIPLVADIAVKQTDNGPIISWSDPQLQIVSERNRADNPTLPTPIGCSSNHFVWQTQHVFEIPKGYSALLTHPLNRHDLPFVTLSGIVDDFVLHKGAIPVYFSSTFEGLIPKGTPILQIILFKTENWKSEIDVDIIKISTQNEFNSSSNSIGWYKKNIWKKKTYE
jgi:hypothetical protein